MANDSGKTPHAPSRSFGRLSSLLIAAIVLAADQGTKRWAIEQISPVGEYPVTDFFSLVFVMNPGVTFGLFPQSERWGVWLLVGAALLIVAVLLWLWWKSPTPFERTVLMVVIGGAIGNVIDRVRFGAVVDFLDFHYAGYHWPAFNVGDSAVVGGLIVYTLLQWKQG